MEWIAPAVLTATAGAHLCGFCGTGAREEWEERAGTLQIVAALSGIAFVWEATVKKELDIRSNYYVFWMLLTGTLYAATYFAKVIILLRRKQGANPTQRGALLGSIPAAFIIILLTYALLVSDPETFWRAPFYPWLVAFLVWYVVILVVFTVSLDGIKETPLVFDLIWGIITWGLAFAALFFFGDVMIVAAALWLTLTFSCAPVWFRNIRSTRVVNFSAIDETSSDEEMQQRNVGFYSVVVQNAEKIAKRDAANFSLEARVGQMEGLPALCAVMSHPTAHGYFCAFAVKRHVTPLLMLWRDICTYQLIPCDNSRARKNAAEDIMRKYFFIDQRRHLEKMLPRFFLLLDRLRDSLRGDATFSDDVFDAVLCMLVEQLLFVLQEFRRSKQYSLCGRKILGIFLNAFDANMPEKEFSFFEILEDTPPLNGDNFEDPLGNLVPGVPTTLKRAMKI